MSLDLLPALLAFAFVTSITPGPNNMMLLASGVNFGVRRSVPHMLGISLGFMLMVIAVGLGLGELFRRLPALYGALRWVGAAYLLYLAWNIARAGAPDTDQASRARPFGFLQAAAFQWVNPKAWVMAVSGVTTFVPAQNFAFNVVLVALLFALVNGPCVSVWTFAGSLLRQWLERPRQRQWFNATMALLLVASLYPLVTDLPGVPG